MRKPTKLPAAGGVLALALLATVGCAEDSEQPSNGDAALELAMNTTNAATEVAPYTGFEIFQEVVAELSDGAITVRNAGGPEAIDPFEMGNVIGTGAIDSAFAAAPYMLSRIPEAAVFTYSPLTVQEMRATDAWQTISEVLAEKLNVHLLGLTLSSLDYNFYTTEPIDSLADFEGMSMRSTPGYQPLLESLGVEGIQMPSGDIFSAMERGLIDGYPQLAVGSVYAFGTEEFVKYKVGPGWWHGDVLLLVDLDYWNSLTPEQQELLEAAAIETEERQIEAIDNLKEDEREKLAEDGIEVVSLNAADGEELQRQAASAGIDFIRSNVTDEGLSDSLVTEFFPEN